MAANFFKPSLTEKQIDKMVKAAKAKHPGLWVGDYRQHLEENGYISKAGKKLTRGDKTIDHFIAGKVREARANTKLDEDLLRIELIDDTFKGQNLGKELNSINDPAKLRYQLKKYEAIAEDFEWMHSIDPDQAKKWIIQDLSAEQWRAQTSNQKFILERQTNPNPDISEVGDPVSGKKELEARRNWPRDKVQMFSANERAYLTTPGADGKLPNVGGSGIRGLVSDPTRKPFKDQFASLRAFAGKLADHKGLTGETRDKYIRRITLNYGHLGPAGVPGYSYLQNNISNQNPEFHQNNLERSAGVTMAEQENLHRRIAANEGFVWNPGEKIEFEKKILGPLTDPNQSIKSGPEVDKALQELDQIPSTRVGLLADESVSPAMYDGVGKYVKEPGMNPDDWTDVIAWERSLDNFDWNAQIARGQAEGVYPHGTKIERVGNMTPENRKTFRNSVVEAMKEFRNNPKATREAIFSRAKILAGKPLWSIAPMALLMYDPELAKIYDDMGRAKGEELFAKVGNSLGISGSLAKVDDALTNAYDAQSEFGSAQAFKGEMARFVRDSVVATVQEVPGIIASAIKPPVAPPENQSWAEQQQSIYNQGILKNNWT